MFLLLCDDIQCWYADAKDEFGTCLISSGLGFDEMVIARYAVFCGITGEIDT